MPTPAFIQNLGTPEIILIFLVVLLLFGAKRLPELFRSFGKSIKEFKKATSEIEDEVRGAMDADDEPKRKPPEIKEPSQTTVENDHQTDPEKRS
ncbi:MAG: twin-arginine translocase TatA/TatE family subunit [Opitutales bacterium]